MIKGVAAAHRCTASLNWSAVPYDALVNDAAMARLTLSAAARMMGSGAVLELEAPSMAAEDFGFLAGARLPPAARDTRDSTHKKKATV